MSFVASIYRIIVAFCAAFGLLLALVPSQVHADGGAPNLAYIAGGSKGVSIIDIGKQQVQPSISIGGDPHSLYLSLDGRFLYVTQPTLGRVTMLSAKNGQTICSASVPGQPTLLTFDPGINVLYAAGNGANSVTAINASTCQILRTLKTQGPVYGLAVAVIGDGISGGTGNQLWVADSTSLNIFNATGQQIDRTIIPGGPSYVSIPQGSTVYVTTRQGTVVAVDLGTHKAFPPLLTGGSFGPMDYDAITGEIYVPDKEHNQLDVLSPIIPGGSIPHEPGSVIKLDVPPQSVAITSDGQFGFVALQGGKVAMLDIPGKQTVMTFSIGGEPTFIITGLYPPAIGTTPQQAGIWETVASITAYVLVAAFILVPVLLLWRYNKRKVAKENL